MRTLTGGGRYQDAELLLGTIPPSYQHGRQSENDHFQALIFAVGRCKDTLTVHSLGPHGLNKRGRPRVVPEYRPIDQLWPVVLRWELPWLFRNELEALPLPTDPPLEFVGGSDDLAVATDELEESDQGDGDLIDDCLPDHRRQHFWATEKYALRTGYAGGVSPAMREALMLKKPNGRPVHTLTAHEANVIQYQIHEAGVAIPYIENCTVSGEEEGAPMQAPTLVERVTQLEFELARQQAFNAEVARQVGIAVDHRAVWEAVEDFLGEIEESGIEVEAA